MAKHATTRGSTTSRDHVGHHNAEHSDFQDLATKVVAAANKAPVAGLKGPEERAEKKKMFVAALEKALNDVNDLFVAP